MTARSARRSRDPQGQGRSPVRVLAMGELERREPGVATGMSARSGRSGRSSLGGSRRVTVENTPASILLDEVRPDPTQHKRSWLLYWNRVGSRAGTPAGPAESKVRPSTRSTVMRLSRPPPMERNV